MTAPAPARLDIEGELTILTAAEHFGRLRALLADSAYLDVGLSGVTDLDTAGLQVLLLARREAFERGGAVRFRKPSPVVGDVLAIAHLGADFGTADSGTADSGTADFGTADSGTAESDTADCGTAESETAGVES